MNTDNKSTELNTRDKKLRLSDVIKSLDELIITEDRIVQDLAVNKLLRANYTHYDEQKLVKYKYRVSALKDFRNSLSLTY